MSDGIPQFLKPVRQVAVAPTVAPEPTNLLPVELPKQSLSHWCWAAVTSAVEDFYGEANAASQCEVATRCFGQPCCPPGPDSDDNPANDTYNLLAALGENAVSPAVGGQIRFEDLQEEIASGRPVCCVIRWNSGDDHVLLAAGYTNSHDVWIDDPASPGLRTFAWESFCKLYGSDGHWVDTVKTKRSGA